MIDGLKECKILQLTGYANKNETRLYKIDKTRFILCTLLYDAVSQVTRSVKTVLCRYSISIDSNELIDGLVDALTCNQIFYFPYSDKDSTQEVYKKTYLNRLIEYIYIELHNLISNVLEKHILDDCKLEELTELFIDTCDSN